jgi:hypothetical protein
MAVRAAAGERPGLGWLWFGFLGPPVIWAVRFMVAYALVPGACSAGGLLALNVVTLVALAGTVLAGVVAARSWGRAGPEPGVEGDPDHTAWRRARFMAMAGIFTSALFTAVIVAEGLANVLVDPCLGSGAPL